MIRTPANECRPQPRLHTWIVSVALATAMAGPPAGAQTPDSVDTAEQVVPEKRAEAMDEIVVTARRRDESLSRVPIAITAISGDLLIERSIRTDSDLQLAAPGLTVRQTQGNNSLTYSIRGQTADTFSGSASAVVTYFNEVPLTVGGASTFFDLESVQVLKGPQGTLFGRNATGGAVLFTSAKPTQEREALIRARVGNLGLREIEGMVNLPLASDAVLFRAAFNVYDRDGYIHNLFDGRNLGDTRRDSGRLSLTLGADSRLSNTTVFQFSETDGTNTGASYTYSVYRCGETHNGFTPTCSSGLLFSPDVDGLFGDGAWDAYLAANPNAYAPGLPAYVEEQRRLGAYVTNHPGGARHEGRDWLLSNTTRFDLTDNLRLKNIFGASHTKTDSEQPQLGAPFVTILTANLATGRSGNELTVDSISDELQLQGTAADGALSYIVGVYLQRQKSDTLWPQTYFDLTPLLDPATATNNFRVRNETDAVYTQATYDLGAATGIDGLSVTTGLRYTWERVSIEQLAEADAFGAAKQSSTFHDPGWEVGLEYQASNAVFTYLKTRGSFRSGGFNGSAPPVSATATEGGNLFASEQVRDVEAGLKARGELAGRPATLNVAVYHQWITDVQRVEFPDPDGDGPIASIAVTANVPEAEVSGLELEATLAALQWLQLGALGAYTDARFTDGRVNLFGTPFQYGPFGDTPEFSGVIYAQLDLPMRGEFGDLALRTELYAQTEQYFSNAADSIAPDTRLPGYALLSSRLSWRNAMGSGFDAALFGKNLLDRTYFAGGMTLAAALGHNAAAVGEPRTWGLEVSYRF